MAAFHDALVLTEVQFPFVFVQVCDYLLVLHALAAPIVRLQRVLRSCDTSWRRSLIFVAKIPDSCGKDP